MFSTDDLRRLDADLAKVAAEAMDGAQKVVGKGSFNVKADARRRISGHPHSPHYPATIGYDVTRLTSEVRSQIGPDKDKRQGALGNILEIGTVNNPPLPHLVPALDDEEPRFRQAAADLGERLFKDNL